MYCYATRHHESLEPPGTEPYAGWCERAKVKEPPLWFHRSKSSFTLPYSIFWVVIIGKTASVKNIHKSDQIGSRNFWIQWLAKVNDSEIIKYFMLLKRSTIGTC